LRRLAHAKAGYGKSHLSVSAMRAIATKQMPLTSRGSPTPAQYANIIAYLLASNCVKPSNGGRRPFPTTDLPPFQTITLVGPVGFLTSKVPVKDGVLRRRDSGKRCGPSLSHRAIARSPPDRRGEF
jgi:hypothetical protein